MIEIEYEGKKVILRACPFCGSDPVIRGYRRHGSWYEIRCGNTREVCSIVPMAFSYKGLEQAVADWNMRPDDVPNLDTGEG